MYMGSPTPVASWLWQDADAAAPREPLEFLRQKPDERVGGFGVVRARAPLSQIRARAHARGPLPSLQGWYGSSDAAARPGVFVAPRALEHDRNAARALAAGRALPDAARCVLAHVRACHVTCVGCPAPRNN